MTICRAGSRCCIVFMQVTGEISRDRRLEAAALYLSSEARGLLASRNPANRLLVSFSADIAAAAAASQLLYNHPPSKIGDRLTLAYGMLERTKVTPMLLHTVTITHHLFCFLLPFGLDLTSYWAPLLIVIISYIFFGLDTRR